MKYVDTIMSLAVGAALLVMASLFLVHAINGSYDKEMPENECQCYCCQESAN